MCLSLEARKGSLDYWSGIPVKDSQARHPAASDATWKHCPEICISSFLLCPWWLWSDQLPLQMCSCFVFSIQLFCALPASCPEKNWSSGWPLPQTIWTGLCRWLQPGSLRYLCRLWPGTRRSAGDGEAGSPGPCLQTKRMCHVKFIWIVASCSLCVSRDPLIPGLES